MKHIMYVFSGTGNTLHIAKLVKNSIIGDKAIIQSIDGRNNKREVKDINADIIGIYFPCYYGSIPNIVKSFVSQMKINKDTYVYSVATAGGNTGYGNKEISKLLEQKGITLSFGADIIYSSNYMPGWYYKRVFKSQEEVKSRINKFIEETEKIARNIVNREKVSIKGSYLGYHMPRIMSASYLVKDSRPHDREFTIGDNCNNCRLCVKVCPVGNIKIENEQHLFKHNCQRCMACVQYCPRQAFEVKGKPMNKERYVNPFISVKEVIDFHQGNANSSIDI